MSGEQKDTEHQETKNKKLSDMDKLYLQHQSNCINMAGQRTFPFLAISVTINGALYYAYYIVNDADLWKYTNLGLFLIFLLILLNLAVYVIYHREHNIDHIINRKYFALTRNDDFEEYCDPKIRDMSKNIDDEDKPDKGVTISVLKFLLGFFLAVPISFLLVYLLKNAKNLVLGEPKWPVIVFATIAGLLTVIFLRTTMYQKIRNIVKKIVLIILVSVVLIPTGIILGNKIFANQPKVSQISSEEQMSSTQFDKTQKKDIFNPKGIINNPDKRYWWSWWISFAVAAGTILLAVAAFIQHRRPCLQISLNNPKGLITNENPVRYYHLCVSNKRRTAPATKVRVHLIKLEELKLNQQPETLWKSGLALLKWRDEDDETMYPKAEPVTIGPELDCDICNVVKGQPSNPNKLKLGFLLCPKTLKPEDRERTKKCIFIATLQAKSISGDSPVVRVKIDWNGEWSDDENTMANKLKLKLI